MKKLSFIVIGSIAWLTIAWGRPFETLEQVEAHYNGRLANGEETPEHKAIVYSFGDLSVLVLYIDNVSEGEAYIKTGRLSEIEVAGMLDANKGTSNWRNEKVQGSTKDAQGVVKAWSREDGKLYAFYQESMPNNNSVLCIGTKKAERFVTDPKKLAALIRRRDVFQ